MRNNNFKEKYMISDLAKLFHIPASTLRYYDKHDVLPFMQRDDLGNRYMDLADISSLFLITSLKHAGCSVDSISKIINLTEQIKNSKKDQLEENTMSALQALYHHIDELNRRQLEIIEQINITRYR